MFDLKLLGPPELLENGKPVRLHQKHLALLAFLSMEPEKPHERVSLSDLLWPDVPLSRADNSLRQALNSLRKSLRGELPLPPLFVAVRGTVALRPDPPLRTDARGLLQPPASCPFFHDPEDCPECRARMQGALREIRGPFMEGFSLPDCEEFENWITGTREELLVRVRWIMNRLIRLNEKRGDVPEALLLLDRALEIDPLDEACHGRKMLLLAEGGNTLAALQQYETCRKTLREQLGKEPDPETRAILEKIRASSPEKRTPLPASRGPVFPDLPFSPEWKPATALYLEIAGEGEEESGEASSGTGELVVRAASKVEALGGTIGRIQGSSLLCWFGISGLTEGAARRAARAALEIGRLVLGGPGEKSRGIAFAAGIHSGRILRGDPSAPPDPTGAVSRPSMALSMRANPGEILVSERASRLLRGQFDLAEAGEVGILGKRMGAFVLGDSVRDDLSGFNPRHIVGRDRELSALTRRWKDGPGGVAVVEGEAGIGKTALVRAFLGARGLRDARLRRIECAPQFMDSPLFPFVQAIRGPARLPEGVGLEEGYARLRDYARIFSFDDEKKAVALLGNLFSLPPHPDFPLPEMSASRLREETSTLLLSILRYRALEGKGLYLVEDLHWIDASSGDLLRTILLDPFFTGKILFLLTTRTGEDPPWLREIPDRSILRLEPLEDADTRALVRTLGKESPGRTLSEPDEDFVVRTSDGVPLFIEELVRERLESPEQSSEEWRDRVPATLSEVLASRLDHLGPARSLLQAASVYGRAVPLTLLRRVFSGPPETFETLLARASGSGLVATETDLSETRLAFRHALIVEASRLSIPQSARLLLHKKYAETLRDGFPDRAGTTPELVARHFEEARVFSDAVLWYEKAARSSYERGAFFESQHFLDKAFALLPRLSSPESGGGKDHKNMESRLLILRGNLLVDMEGNGSRGARQSFRKALDILDVEAGVSEEAFQALYGYWGSLYGGMDIRYSGMDIRDSRKAADSLHGLSRKSESSSRRIAALYADGSTAFWEGRSSRSFEILAQGLSLGIKSEGAGKGGGLLREAALVQSGDYQFWNLWFLGRYRSALSAVEKSLGRVSENVQKKGHSLTFSAVTFRYLRLPERVFGVLDNLKGLIGTAGIEGWSPSEKGFRGWAQVMTGEASGIGAILNAVRLSRKFHWMAEIKYLSILAEAYLSLSDIRRSRGTIDSALRFSGKFGTIFFDAELWRLKGETALLEGRREEARECFGTALEIGRRQGARALELRAATSLGRLLGDAGKRKEALALFYGLSELLDGPESDPSLPDIRDALDLRKRLS
ncbi:MAG: BTAD domain-containing putative transcriptional regulator [Nitrospiraceae bacterium]|nr:BTAD domain-containing putative transcriptional regulator [Nitrospiraceae bacterium]